MKHIEKYEFIKQALGHAARLSAKLLRGGGGVGVNGLQSSMRLARDAGSALNTAGRVTAGRALNRGVGQSRRVIRNNPLKSFGAGAALGGTGALALSQSNPHIIGGPALDQRGPGKDWSGPGAAASAPSNPPGPVRPEDEYGDIVHPHGLGVLDRKPGFNPYYNPPTGQ